MTRLIDTLPEPEVIREKKVIVLSRSRVGTFSLYQAMKMLGYKPYHMWEVVNNGTIHMEILEEALRCKFLDGGKPYGKAEFDKWLAAYDSVIEIPQFFVDEFIEFYPDAQFILMERKMESWTRSLEATINPLLKSLRSFPFIVARKIDKFMDRFCSLHFVLDDVWFHGKGSDNGMDDAVRDVLRDNKKAKAVIPKERLLVVKLEDGFGWEQICPFLGHDIPSTPYPRGNAPAEFAQLGKQILGPGIRKVAALAVSVVLVPVVGVGAWYFFKDR
ncbi:hypothetical protein F4821DRAFT_124710 [Hypoxylon rubiginosum]|uniref:Uncharacterized protein n=1 Tax=Hypoxylon rubiginosum TaxID=110542 RepID=A0ACC0D1V8_9PEZI|nr:hypothetical protein F4821DRAFT_124710 [Hypoxylon rubiginosum]